MINEQAVKQSHAAAQAIHAANDRADWKMGAYQFKVVRMGKALKAEHFADRDVALKFWNKTIMRAQWFEQDKEQVVALFLDAERNVMGYNLVSIGSDRVSVASPREIFRAAIVAGAWGIVLMHNHPSGDTTPSGADKSTTATIIMAGELVEVHLLDHLIVNREGTSYTSVLKVMNSELADKVAEKLGHIPNKDELLATLKKLMPAKAA
jgi:DNA repair protein RadC